MVIVGYIIVMISVFGGFAMAGGHLAALFQPLELLMIGGAAFGSFFVGNNPKTIKVTLKTLPQCFKGSKYTKALYMEVLGVLYEILTKVRRDGMLSIEQDVEKPEESAAFKKYPLVLGDHHLVEFMTDYLRMMTSGNLNAFQIEALMDSELQTHHHESEVPVNAITKVGDGMPAFGIVAAVMGVVHTMESLGLPPSELGILIAHALVGTFLGILLSYGFVGPLAGLLTQKAAEGHKALECVKVTLLASMNDYAPAVAVEFGRKVLFSTERPSFTELEGYVKQPKAAG